MQLILRNAAGLIRTSFFGVEGEAVAEPSNPTVTIVRDSDDQVLVEAAAATADGAEATYTVPASSLPDVDLLRVSWAADNAAAPDAEVGVVGGWICSLEAIAPDATATVARALRETVEEFLEDACRVAFRPRYERDLFAPVRRTDCLVPSRPLLRRVLRATIDGEAIDVSTLTVDANSIRRPEGFLGRVEIWYEHGHDAAPADIAAAAVQLGQHLAAGGEPSRITRFREDDQEVWLTQAGIGGALTPIPEVNAAIDHHRFLAVG